MQGTYSEDSQMKNNKKSEFFGFFGYPYGYYGNYYGRGGGYWGDGGYDNYRDGSYPYAWSRWWCNNGYGKPEGPGVKIIIIHSKHENERRLATPGIVTKKEAEIAAEWFAEANITVYDFIAGKDASSKFETWWYALQEESAVHGSLGKTPITNVTKDDLFTTAKIAVAHFRERPDYYHRLFELLNQSQAVNHKQPGSIQTQLPGPQEKNVGMKGLPSRRQHHHVESQHHQGTVYYYYETPERRGYDADYHY